VNESLLLDALHARNKEEEAKASRARAELLVALRRTLGRRHAKRAVFEGQDAVIDGVRFRGRLEPCYGGSYAVVEASFGGDSWVRIHDLPSLGAVLLERHERLEAAQGSLGMETEGLSSSQSTEKRVQGDA